MKAALMLEERPNCGLRWEKRRSDLGKIARTHTKKKNLTDSIKKKKKEQRKHKCMGRGRGTELKATEKR